MKRSTIILIGVVVAAIAVFGVLSTFYLFAPAPAPGVIKLGFIAELTGPMSSLATEGARGAELAVDEINAKGGLNVAGRQYRVELVYLDTQASVDLAKSGAEKLITQDKVLMLIGTVWTPSALTVSRIAEEHKTPFIVSMSAAAGLGKQVQTNNWKYIFQTSTSGEVIGRTLAAAAIDLVKPKSVAVVGQDSDWGRGAAEPFVEYIKKNSPTTVVSRPEYTPAGTSDFSAVLAKIRALNPDMVFESLGGVEQQTFAAQKYDAGLRMPLFSAGSVPASEKYVSDIGMKAEYQVVFLQWAPKPITPETMPFVERYRAKYGNLALTGMTAFTYDAFQAAFNAIQGAGALDKEAIAKALLETNIKGVAGLITFDPTTHTRQMTPPVGQIQGGKFVTIYPKEISDGPYKPPA